MAKIAKWIGGALGWAAGGPVGAILGLFIGSAIDSAGNDFRTNEKNAPTREGDYNASLLILMSKVMKADGSIKKSELNFVKEFLSKNYTNEKANEYLRLLRELLDKEIPIADVCLEIRRHMGIEHRRQLVYYLFQLASADGELVKSEVNVIEQIARSLQIPQKDYMSMYYMFWGREGSEQYYQNHSEQQREAEEQQRRQYQRQQRQSYKTYSSDAAYKILEISSSATDDEVKKAYRSLAKKYHPDKFVNLGEAHVNGAKEKFQKVQEAYEKIKTKRGLK